MKYSLAVMALLSNTSAVELSKKNTEKFAEGMGRMEHMNESVTMKGPTKMDTFNYL